MKRLFAILELALCLAIVLPMQSHTAETRGIQIVDTSGYQVGLYENSYAVVIGISDYTNGWPDLPGVREDAAVVKKTLEEQGFKVTVVEDANYEELDQAFDDFINRHGRVPNDRLVFYFAGHGYTVKLAYGGEMGYIVPADAPNPNKDPDGFKARAIDMQMMEVYAKRIECKHALFLFDSCFSGSIFALSRGIPESISYKTANPVRQFITSGSAGEEVPDESVFRRQFVAALNGDADTNGDGYVTGMELGEFLHTTVINYSRGSQHPQYGKIRDPNLDRGDFVFQIPKKTPDLPERPPDVSFNLDDLEEQAKQIESAKAAWASALEKMKEDFSKVKEFQERDILPEMKASAWELFLKTFAADNPYSQEDDQMKQEASQQVKYWKAVKEPLPKPEPVEEPKKPPEARITKVGADGATMILIPAGEFQMGSDGVTSDEKPVHAVYLDAFYIDQHEVTNRQYRQFVEATGHREPEGYTLLANGNWRYGFKPWSDENFNGADQPVVCVTWEDAKAYCDWAGKRLPTEAEWEKAARDGLVEGKYVWGEAWPPSSGAGNFADETFRSAFPNELFIADYADRYIYTSPVGSFDPNGYGLYDMAGNVWEWCADWLDGGYYKTSPGRNPTGPGSGSYRVFRGGSWLSDPNNLLVALRQGGKPAGPYSDGGFRCVSEE